MSGAARVLGGFRGAQVAAPFAVRVHDDEGTDPFPARCDEPRPELDHEHNSPGTVRIRVRYCECDPMGVAHHAAYAPWLEIARTEMLRESGVTYADMERAGVFLVITRLECRYRRPIYYDDLVEVRTRVVGGSKVKIQHEYEIVVVEGGGRGKRGREAGEAVWL